MRDTALVDLMVKGGLGRGRAQSLERYLDDKLPAGVSGDMLAGIILGLITLANLSRAEYVDQLELQVECLKGPALVDRCQLKFWQH